jgi:endonuclease YncB( thermonuclease family)
MVLSHDFVNFPELSNSQLQEFQFSSPHPQILADFEAVVERVHDGDTVTLSTSGRDFLFPLRLLDIDAPELNEGGEEAGDWLRDRILGSKVLVLIDPNNRVGKYGRLLGKILHNGLDVGDEMLRAGRVVPFGSKNEGLPDDINKTFNLRQWFG